MNELESVTLNMPIITAFVVYAALMLGVGFYFFKRNETTQDYFLGDRKMGPVVSALSAGASDMSGWLLMGLPGALYVGGFVSSYIAIGLTIGATLNWIFVAKRLRIYTSVITDSITIPDYFETRFSDDAHILRVICAVVILIFFTIYISAGLVSGAKLFEATFSLKYDYALTIGTLIIVAYTFFGGYRAVCWTDLIQGLLMMGSLVVVAVVMFIHIGGFDEVRKYIANSDKAKIQIVTYQKNIPSIIDEISINPALTSQILTPLIRQLEQTRDTKFVSDSESNQIILAKDFANQLQEALIVFQEDKKVDILKQLLLTLGGFEIHTNNRLTFFEEASLLSIISAIAWGLGYFGQPHILVRFMSIRSIRDIKAATAIGISWMVISLVAACIIGIFGVAYINKFNLSLYDSEKIFISMSQILFNPWVAGILLSAILAAIMSTASSQLLVSSSTIAEDFYRRVFKKDAPEKAVMFVSRSGVLLVSIIAFVISTNKDSSILDIVAYAWAGFGASFGSVIVFSLFWGRMTRMGAVAGMITGAVVVVVYKHFLGEWLGFPIYEIVPGFLCASIAIVFVSLLQPLRADTKAVFMSMLKEVHKQ